MRAFVFTDTSLRSEAGRFVWLEIDTEKAKNAAIRKRLSINALPTYFVVDPDDEHVMMKWLGSATVAQMHERLDQAWAMRQPATSGAEEALANADHLYGDAQYSQAAAGYRAALKMAPAGWSSRARATEALLFSLQETEDYPSCVTLARQAYPRLKGTPTAVNVATVGLDAALQLPASDSLRKENVSYFESATREVLADTTVKIAGDDRSGAMIALLDARKDAGDSLGARRVAAEWAALLEAEAAKAKTSEERAVYDSHRLNAYIELGQPERAIPMLQASERDLPDDYNPPARLAVAYQNMRRWDDALAASDRALAKVYGPRKLRVLQTRADIFAGRGDAPGARQTLEEAVQFAEGLPEGQRSEATIAALKKKLEKLP